MLARLRTRLRVRLHEVIEAYRHPNPPADWVGPVCFVTDCPSRRRPWATTHDVVSNDLTQEPVIACAQCTDNLVGCYGFIALPWPHPPAIDVRTAA